MAMQGYQLLHSMWSRVAGENNGFVLFSTPLSFVLQRRPTLVFYFICPNRMFSAAEYSTALRTKRQLTSPSLGRATLPGNNHRTHFVRASIRLLPLDRITGICSAQCPKRELCLMRQPIWALILRLQPNEEAMGLTKWKYLGYSFYGRTLQRHIYLNKPAKKSSASVSLIPTHKPESHRNDRRQSLSN